MLTVFSLEPIPLLVPQMELIDDSWMQQWRRLQVSFWQLVIGETRLNLPSCASGHARDFVDTR